MAHETRRLRHVCALVAVGLTLASAPGCGFRPMYGDRGTEASPVAADLATVSVGLIPDRSGQLLRNQLNRLLNPASESASRRYTLVVTLKETVDSFAVERSGFATRANVEMVATYQLVDDAAGSPVFAATSRAVSGYNLLDNDFSTVVSTGDARSRAIDQIAYEIRNRLAGYFSKAPTAMPAAAPASMSLPANPPS